MLPYGRLSEARRSPPGFRTTQKLVRVRFHSLIASLAEVFFSEVFISFIYTHVFMYFTAFRITVPVNFVYFFFGLPVHVFHNFTPLALKTSIHSLDSFFFFFMYIYKYSEVYIFFFFIILE